MGFRGKVAVATAALVVAATGAAFAFTSGPPTASQSSLSFGNWTVGLRSSPQSVVVTVPCPALGGTDHTVCVPESTSYPMSIKATGDYIANGANCPSVLVAANPAVPVSCVINVTFKPSKTGKRTGTLTTGANPGSPEVFLEGHGVKGKVTKCKKIKKKSKKSSAAKKKHKKCKKKKKTKALVGQK
jgi:hypothetical protein